MKQKTKYKNSLESNFFEKQIRKKAIPPNQIQRANTREPKHPPPLETSPPLQATVRISGHRHSTRARKYFSTGKTGRDFYIPPHPLFTVLNFRKQINPREAEEEEEEALDAYQTR